LATQAAPWNSSPWCYSHQDGNNSSKAYIARNRY